MTDPSYFNRFFILKINSPKKIKFDTEFYIQTFLKILSIWNFFTILNMYLKKKMIF